MWNEVQEGVTQQSPRREAQQHLQQVLVLVAVGLNWNEEQDEERSRADQQGRSDSLRTGNEGSSRNMTQQGSQRRRELSKG